MNRTKCQESSPHISLLDTCAKSVNDVRSAHRTLAKEKVVSRRLRSATWDHQRVTTVYVANRL